VPLVSPQAASTAAAVTAINTAITTAGSSTTAIVAAVAGSSQAGVAAPNCSAPCLQEYVFTSLPDLGFAPEDLGVTHFALQTFPDAREELTVVGPHLEEYRQFRATPVHSQRPDWVSFLQPTTWPSHCSNIMRFLGFLWYFMGVAKPMLQHYLNLNLVMSYISFQVARGMTPEHLAVIAHDARVVSEWVWQTQHTPQQRQVLQFMYQKHQEQLISLGKQCSHNIRPDPQQVLHRMQVQQQRRDSMDAAHLVVIMYSLWLQAMERLPFKDLNDVLFVQEVLMCCMFFGFVPPQRVSVVVSLQLLGSKCLHPNCQHRDTCFANHVGPHSDGSGRLVLFEQHTKHERWSAIPIEVVLPVELVQLFNAYYPAGRNMLIESEVGLGTPKAAHVPPYLFIHPVMLEPYFDSQMNKIWKRLVLPEAKVQFGPQWCRTIFVEERSDGGRVAPELDDHAAAKAMGHCLGVWSAAYDKLRHHRGARNVHQYMPEWRRQLLEHFGASNLLKQGHQLLADKQAV
jgi:hypothetical protein